MDPNPPPPKTRRGGRASAGPPGPHCLRASQAPWEPSHGATTGPAKPRLSSRRPTPLTVSSIPTPLIRLLHLFPSPAGLPFLLGAAFCSRPPSESPSASPCSLLPPVTHRPFSGTENPPSREKAPSPGHPDLNRTFLPSPASTPPVDGLVHGLSTHPEFCANLLHDPAASINEREPLKTKSPHLSLTAPPKPGHKSRPTQLRRWTGRRFCWS